MCVAKESESVQISIFSMCFSAWFRWMLTWNQVKRSKKWGTKTTWISKLGYTINQPNGTPVLYLVEVRSRAKHFNCTFNFIIWKQKATRAGVDADIVTKLLWIETKSLIVRPSKKKNINLNVRIELAFVPYSYGFFLCDSVALLLSLHNSDNQNGGILYIQQLWCSRQIHLYQPQITTLSRNHLKGFASILFLTVCLIVAVLLLLKLQKRFHSLFPPFSSFKDQFTFGDLFYAIWCLAFAL